MKYYFNIVSLVVSWFLQVTADDVVFILMVGKERDGVFISIENSPEAEGVATRGIRQTVSGPPISNKTYMRTVETLQILLDGMFENCFEDGKSGEWRRPTEGMARAPMFNAAINSSFFRLKDYIPSGEKDTAVFLISDEMGVGWQRSVPLEEFESCFETIEPTACIEKMKEMLQAEERFHTFFEGRPWRKIR